MRNSCRNVSLLLVGVYSLALGSLAEGAIQNVTITGSVLTADAGNLFGLNVGDPISLQATFDDTTAISPGIIPFNSSTTNLLTMTLGTIQLAEVNDIDYSGSYPRLTLCDDPVLPVFMIDYGAIFGENGALADYLQVTRTQFLAIDANGTMITGEWVLSNCPEPSTVVLAGMALAGVVVRRVRRGG
jgi:hypothetical protein